MITITPHMRILVARDPLDFRKGMDSTAALCRRGLGQDPLSGTLFVFRNTKGTMVRILVYDGQGLWLMTKRLSKGRFPNWQAATDDSARQLQAHQMQLLLAGGQWSQADAPEPWRPIAP